MGLYICLAAFMEGLLLVSQSGRLEDRPAGKWTVAEKSLFAAAFALLWFLTAFRATEIGNDTAAYMRMYSKYSAQVSLQGVEIGWQVLCRLLGLLSSDPRILIVTVSTVLYALAGLYIYKYSRNLLFSTALFFALYFSPFANILRQSLAMCVVMFAYQQLDRGRNARAAAMILFAALFHWSALVALLLFLSKVPPKKAWWAAAVCGVCLVLSMSGLASRLLPLVLPKYQAYFSSQYAGDGFLAVSAEIALDLLLCWVAYESGRVGKDSLLFTDLFLLVLVSSFGYSVSLFTRAAGYFAIIAWLELPALAEGLEPRRRRIVSIAGGTLMLAYFLVILWQRPGWNHLYPYRFFWSA